MIAKIIQNIFVSWKSSAIGILVFALQMLHDPTITDWKSFCGAALILLLGLITRDGDKSSEQTGAKDNSGSSAGPLGLVLLCMLMLPGCAAKRSPELKNADGVRKAAIQNYAASTTQIEGVVTDAYRQECFKHIDDLFQWDMEKLEKAAGGDGRVSVADAKVYVMKIITQREQNRAAVDIKLQQLQAALQASNRDLVTFLRLDDLMQQWMDAGVDASAASSAVQSIISILQANKPAPALGAPGK